MRLAEVLSKPINQDFLQVEGFLDNKSLKVGKQKKLSIGKIALNFFCKECDEMRTFSSQEELYCIGINKNKISIDCVLECQICKTIIPMWFLIESNDDIFSRSPEVRLIRCEQKLSDKVALNKNDGIFAEFIEKAERAYKNGLGAGANIYLRIVLEQITKNIAVLEGISITGQNGGRKPFKDLLKEVDRKCSIVPSEFSANRYRLFAELSECAHGNCDEQTAIEKYMPLKRLVTGIIDNVKNKAEIKSALESLNWNCEDGNAE